MSTVQPMSLAVGEAILMGLNHLEFCLPSDTVGLILEHGNRVNSL